MKTKKIISCLAVVLLGLSFSIFAGSVADWAETFHLKGGNWVRHTPHYVNLDGFIQSGNSIDIDGKLLNGISLSKCGFHIKTDSTREEFVKALECSGLYPI